MHLFIYIIFSQKCGMFHFTVLFTALHVFSHFKQYANVEMLIKYWKFVFVFFISTSVFHDAAQIYSSHFEKKNEKKKKKKNSLNA